jgi:hypothetical protein
MSRILLLRGGRIKARRAGLGVPYREGREVISGQGSFDVQVCGPESPRLTGHCLYLTLNQLKRFKQAVPELLERSRN